MWCACILIINELLSEGAILNALQVVLHALTAGLVYNSVGVVTILSGVGARPASLVQATFVHEVYEHLQLVAYLEVCDFWLVASISKNFEAHFYELVYATHKNVLLTEEIGFSFFLEGSLNCACTQSADTCGVCKGNVPSIAVWILLNCYNYWHAATFGVLTANNVTRTLWSNHEYWMILRWLDVAVMNVKAVCESNCSAWLQVWLNVVCPNGALVLIWSQNHNDVCFCSCICNRLHFEALFLCEFYRLRIWAKTNYYVYAGIAQVECVCVTLGTVTNDCYLLAIEN